MASAYVEVIRGVGLGLIVGVVPAVAAALVGAVAPGLRDQRYVRGALAAVALPVAAGLSIQLGVVATQLDQIPRATAGGIVVVLGTVYAFEQGTQIDSVLRRDGADPVERGRPLSSAAITAVDASGQVTIRPSGEIRSISGYPDLPPELRAAIQEERFRLPADLPLGELEDRIERQLEGTYDLEAVEVTVDARGTASVAAAPPVGGIAHQVPEDCRAVSIDTTIPAGVEPGDEVLVEAEGGLIQGVVLSAIGPEEAAALAAGEDGDASTVDDGRVDATAPVGHRSDSAAVRCRLTVAVPTTVADALLEAPRVPVAVRSRDTSPDFQALSLLDRAGHAVRVTTLSDAHLDVLDAGHDDVGVFAAREPDADTPDAWAFDPDVDALAPGWDAVLVGDETRLGDVVGEATADGEVIEA